MIHPSCKIGVGTVIGPNVTIEEGVVIGNHCTISGPPEHRLHWHTEGKGVFIGAGSFISNNCTIDSGVEDVTWIGRRVTLLRGTHVGHDAEVRDGATLSCNVLVGGHCLIGEDANLGLGVIVHQRCHVPSGVMIGAAGLVVKASILHPNKVYVGQPVRYLRDQR